MEWENTNEFEGSLANDRIMAMRMHMRSAMLHGLPGVAAQAARNNPGLLRGGTTNCTEDRVQSGNHPRDLRFRHRVINSLEVGGLPLLPQGHIAGMWYIRSPTTFSIPGLNRARPYEGNNHAVVNLGLQFWTEDGCVGVISAIPWEGETDPGCVVLTNTFSGSTDPSGYHLQLINAKEEEIHVRKGMVIALLYHMSLVRPQHMQVDLPSEMIPSDCLFPRGWSGGCLVPRGWSEVENRRPGLLPQPSAHLSDHRLSTPLSVGRESLPPSELPTRAMLNPAAPIFIPRRTDRSYAPSAPPMETTPGTGKSTRLSSRLSVRQDLLRQPEEAWLPRPWSFVDITSSGSRTGGRTNQGLPSGGSKPDPDETRPVTLLPRIEPSRGKEEKKGEKEKNPEPSEDQFLQNVMDIALEQSRQLDMEERESNTRTPSGHDLVRQLHAAAPTGPSLLPRPPPPSSPKDDFAYGFLPETRPPPANLSFNLTKKPPRQIPLEYHSDEEDRKRQIINQAAVNYCSFLIEEIQEGEKKAARENKEREDFARQKADLERRAQAMIRASAEKIFPLPD